MEGIEIRLWRAAKARARKKNLEFTISPEDIVVPKKCPVLETVLDTNGRLQDSPSLDRIDSARGYTPDNIWVISHKANTIKSNATPRELLMLSKRVSLATLMARYKSGLAEKGIETIGFKSR